MKINEDQWKSMKIIAKSMKTNENLWKSMKSHWESYRNSLFSEFKVDGRSQLRLKIDRKTCLRFRGPAGNNQGSPGTSGDVQSSRFVWIRDSLNVCTTYAHLVLLFLKNIAIIMNHGWRLPCSYQKKKISGRLLQNAHKAFEISKYSRGYDYLKFHRCWKLGPQAGFLCKSRQELIQFK